jgi:hypothetical protein
MSSKIAHDPSRRRVIQSMACGSLLLPGVVSELLAADGTPAAASVPSSVRRPGGVPRVDPLAARPPHFAPRPSGSSTCS